MSYRNVVMTRQNSADVGTTVSVSDYISGDNSLWNMHGLELRSNRLHRAYCEERVSALGNDWRISPWSRDGNLFRYVPLEWDNLEAKSYAQLRRKLYQGSASLGVTLGSYKQSREMIVNRYQQLNRKADIVLARALTKKLTPKDIASIHLEVIFGWTPLLADIHAAVTTVIDSPPIQKWIKVVSREVQTSSKILNWSDPWLEVNIQHTYYAYHGRGVLVTVSNPNKWLAERAGLLNPVSVAWDLVPWSFVVNMFVNTGQLVNSITDFAGLSFSNGYSYRKATGTSYWNVPPEKEWPYRSGVTQLHWGRFKEQFLGAVTGPPLAFKIPDMNWGTAAMAASLFTQKFSGIAGLIKSSYRHRHVYTE